MALPVDYESEDYRFYKTLNEDAELSHKNKSEYYDVKIENGDYVNVTGKKSLSNAIVIAIMTRFNELHDIPLYENFGCRIHDLIKDNQSEMVEYEMGLFITDVLENMRRIQEINELEVTPNSEGYKIYFKVTDINDEMVSGSVVV